MENKEQIAENLQDTPAFAKLPVMRRFFVCGYCGNEVNAYGMECSSPDFDNNNAEIIEGVCCVESVRYGSF